MQIEGCNIFMSPMWLHLVREKGKRPLDLFSSGFFLLEEYIKNSEGQCKATVRSGARWPPAFTLVLGSIYLRCSGSAMFTCFLGSIYLRWSGSAMFTCFLPSNDCENVERRTYIPQTLNSMSVHTESTSVKGEHQRRILTEKPLVLSWITNVPKAGTWINPVKQGINHSSRQSILI